MNKSTRKGTARGRFEAIAAAYAKLDADVVELREGAAEMSSPSPPHPARPWPALSGEAGETFDS